MNKPIVLIGSGGHAFVLTEILRGQKRKIAGYTSLVSNGSFNDLKYLGTDDSIQHHFDPDDIELVLAIGSVNVPLHRKKIFDTFKSLGYKFGQVIHSSSIISTSSKIGEGVQIMAGVIIQPNVTVSDNAIINTGTIIDHDCSIGSHVHIAPGTTISGGVTVGELCHVGTGTSIIQGITIGNETLIGAGSVIVKDIGSRKKVFGVPAKEV